MESYNPGSDELSIALFVIALLFIVMLIGLLPMLFYLGSLQKALTRCAPHNRLMQPGLVWLMLIPFFGMIWHFFLVINIAGSLEKEFAEQNIPSEPQPGKSLGLAMCILNACRIIPYIGILPGLGGFVCWIIYWIKIAECSAKLNVPLLQPANTFEFDA